MKLKPKFALLFFTLLALNLASCSKSFYYKTKYKQLKRTSEKRNTNRVSQDTVYSLCRKKTLIPKQLISILTSIYVSNDTVCVKREEWKAFRRVSPNTRQIITKTEKLYVKNIFIYENTKILSLLMGDSSEKTILRYRSKSGKIEEVIKEGSYDLFEKILEGLFLDDKSKPKKTHYFFY